MERRAIVKEWDGTRNTVMINTVGDSVEIKYTDGLVHVVNKKYFWSIEVPADYYIDIIPHAMLSQGLITSNRVIGQVAEKTIAESAEVVVENGCQFIRLTNPKCGFGVIRALGTKVRSWDEFSNTIPTTWM